MIRRDCEELIKTLNIQIRDCSRFIPVASSSSMCGCGKVRKQHRATVETGKTVIPWAVLEHTTENPTDAYGTLEFQGGIHPKKAQYIKLAFDTDPDQITQLFFDGWNMEYPKLIITVNGGVANFSLEQKLTRVFRTGLLNAVKTTDAWIITSGLNSGVVRHVSSALAEASQRKSTKELVVIGIAPWGMIRRRDALRDKNRTISYHSKAVAAKSRFAVLNDRHNFFLLADNGTCGRYGAEMILRQRLEERLANMELKDHPGRRIPVVSVCLDGEFFTVCNMWNYVYCEPPIPVLICGRSSRLSTLLSTGASGLQEDKGSYSFPKDTYYDLRAVLVDEFGLKGNSAEIAMNILKDFLRKRDFIDFFQFSEAGRNFFEYKLLTAILKQSDVSQDDQLTLALDWNRVDIARSDIFVLGREWEQESLEHAFMNALLHDRVEFVELLLKNGVSIEKFLTIEKLEELYQMCCSPDSPNTLRFALEDVMSRNKRKEAVTLLDIGLVVQLLMGPGFTSEYRTKNFQQKYHKYKMRRNWEPEAEIETTKRKRRRRAPDFHYPFNELMIWAVLTNKSFKMSEFLWTRNEETLAKGLMACRLYSALAENAMDDDIVHNMSLEFSDKAKRFRQLTLEFLDYCWNADSNATFSLLTYELRNWGRETCISLAARADHQKFIAHPSVQTIILDLWKGGLNMRKRTTLYVIAGCVFPPCIYFLQFKTTKQLEEQPTTALEHDSSQKEYNESQDDSLTTVTITENLSTEGRSVGGADKSETKRKKTARKKSERLSWTTRYYEFYNAPITIFWMNVISYIIFLGAFGYIVLIETPPSPSGVEIYVTATVLSIGVDLFRKLFGSPPEEFSSKWKIFAHNRWNVVSLVAVLVFVMAFGLRMSPTMVVSGWGRVFYCVSAGFWYMRIYNFLNVHPALGVYINIFWKMIIQLIQLIGLTTVVLVAFGLVRQSVLFPGEKEWDWLLVRNVFYQPYFMLYGEVYADQIDVCGDAQNETERQEKCVPGVFLVVIFMAGFLLVANIVMIGSLLIAVFNNIYSEINAVANQLWKFQRYSNVMEYQAMPVFPPPFIIVGDVYQVIRNSYRVWKELRPADYSLKLFPEEEKLEQIHDFEEECVEEMQRLKRTATVDDVFAKMTEKLEKIDEMDNALRLVAERVGRTI